MRSFFHIVFNKNIGVFQFGVINVRNFKETLTVGVFSFEQPSPEHLVEVYVAIAGKVIPMSMVC